MARLSDTAHPLRSRPIAALITAQVISSLGSQMTFLALPWFVLRTTGSPTRMSIVLAAELLPIAILGIPSGSVIAKLGARRTMLLADLARAPLIASIPLLHELGLLGFPLLLVIVASIGVFTIGSPFTLNDVFMITGTPVISKNARRISWKRSLSSRRTVCTRALPSTCVTAGMRARQCSCTGTV